MDTSLLVLLVVIYLSLVYGWRKSRQAKNEKLDAVRDCDTIYKNLACFEFPWEAFYGINFAFYRTFSSPTIAGIYHATQTIEKTSDKRVYDTDILMHAWFDFGVDSALGKQSWEHLNKIHSGFANRTRNEDFVYVLCCFVADTIRFIDVFGMRSLSPHEKEAIFHFWMKVGSRMLLRELPSSLNECTDLVKNYVDSDEQSRVTDGGIALTEAITALITRWYWFIPRFLVRAGVPALLYVVGGPVFVRKLGLQQPSSLMINILYIGSFLRRIALAFLPPRIAPHQLSAKLFNQYYGGPINFSKVGPPSVIAAFKSQH